MHDANSEVQHIDDIGSLSLQAAKVKYSYMELQGGLLAGCQGDVQYLDIEGGLFAGSQDEVQYMEIEGWLFAGCQAELQYLQIEGLLYSPQYAMV